MTNNRDNGDAMIGRMCRLFSDTFATDEATAKAQNKKYWISRVLGTGATGVVLSAKRSTTGETFAVKCVDMEGMSEADKNRAQAEVHCLLNCDFFSILKCHEDFPEMADIVASLLCGDPQKRPSSSKLLNTSLCKLFMSGLLEIVQSQPAFQGELRETIARQIQETKQHLTQQKKMIQRQMEASAGCSTSTSTTILEGAQPLSSSIGGLTLYEGIVQKQSSDMVWKRRYLCIRAELDDDQSPTNMINPKFKSLDLVLAVSKETMEQQCIATPFSELEDVFMVPNKYTGSNASHVFAVAFKTGKRLSFQARNDSDRSGWMEKIQEFFVVNSRSGRLQICMAVSCLQRWGGIRTMYMLMNINAMVLKIVSEKEKVYVYIFGIGTTCLFIVLFLDTPYDFIPCESFVSPGDRWIRKLTKFEYDELFQIQENNILRGMGFKTEGKELDNNCQCANTTLTSSFNFFIFNCCFFCFSFVWIFISLLHWLSGVASPFSFPNRISFGVELKSEKKQRYSVKEEIKKGISIPGTNHRNERTEDPLKNRTNVLFTCKMQKSLFRSAANIRWFHPCKYTSSWGARYCHSNALEDVVISQKVSDFVESFGEARTLIAESHDNAGTTYFSDDLNDAVEQTNETLKLWEELQELLQQLKLKQLELELEAAKDLLEH
eukprot:gene5058-3645_t